MGGSGNLEAGLQDIDQKFDILEAKRKAVKKTSYFFTFATLALLLFFIFFTIKQLDKIDTNAVVSLTAKSPQIQQVSKDLMQKTTSQTLPKVHQAFVSAFVTDPSFAKEVKNELRAFLTVFRNDLSTFLKPEYARLVVRQKQHLYSVFPEFRNNANVEKAIQNTIKIGGPALQQVLIDRFEEHIKALYTIYNEVEDLRDESLADLPSLEQATLGITLELFGSMLRAEGEGSNG